MLILHVSSVRYELSLDHQCLSAETMEDNSYDGVIVPPSTSKETTKKMSVFEHTPLKICYSFENYS